MSESPNEQAVAVMVNGLWACFYVRPARGREIEDCPDCDGQMSQVVTQAITYQGELIKGPPVGARRCPGCESWTERPPPRLTRESVVYGDRRGVSIDGERLDPARCLRLRNHSPTGFMWGYSGSGPAQLALGLLLETSLSEDEAVGLYQRFKSDVIAKLRGDDGHPAGMWHLDGARIYDWIEWIEGAAAAFREAAASRSSR